MDEPAVVCRRVVQLFCSRGTSSLRAAVKEKDRADIAIGGQGLTTAPGSAHHCIGNLVWEKLAQPSPHVVAARLSFSNPNDAYRLVGSWEVMLGLCTSPDSFSYESILATSGTPNMISGKPLIFGPLSITLTRLQIGAGQQHRRSPVDNEGNNLDVRGETRGCLHDM